MVLASGGDITVESQLNAGSKFRVFLPAANPPQEPPHLSLVPTFKKRARVLVIDDEELIGRTIERLLARDHDVYLETDPRQAITRMSVEAYDVILCDLTMPGMSGVDVYDAVLLADAELAARIVFITGGVLSDEHEEFIEACSNIVLRKPFSSGQLLSIVSSYVR